MSALALLLALALPPDDGPFVATRLALTPGTRLLALRDGDGDGRLDLFAIGDEGVSVRRMRADGRYPEAPDAALAWPSDRVGWDLVDADGDGATDVLLLVDGRAVRTHRLAGDFAAGTTLLEPVAGFLPAGVRRLRFARDVDGDGVPDLAIPAADRYRIHLARGGGFAEPLEVSFDASIDIDVGDPERLGQRFGQDVSIPWFRIEDHDGDGRADLLSETDTELLVYLARDGLPSEPTWRLDVAALEAEMEEPGRVDLDDLLSMIPPQVHWKVADLDGVAPLDLVLGQGGRFRVFLGGTTGPRLDAPDQVLKASGNVLYFLLRDTDGDGRVDLQLVRGEKISVGRVLRWLVLAGSLDFDVFTYANEGGAFARRPTGRKTITLRIPGLLDFAERAEDLDERLEARLHVPTRAASFDGGARWDDVADLRDGALQLYADLLPEGDWDDLRDVASVDDALEALLLGDLDRLEEGGVHEIDLEQIEALVPTPAWDMRQLALAAEPFARHPLPEGETAFDEEPILVRDLDGDGRTDLVVAGRDGEGRAIVELLVLR